MTFQKSKFEALLETDAFGKEIYCLEKVNSTNDYLKKLAQVAESGSVVVAEEQFAGQGRMGKRWISQPSSSLLMSLLIKPVDIAAHPALTLVCGLTVARALNRMCGGGFKIKWPNDIVYNEKKVAGIVCEAQYHKGFSSVVCGIGINLFEEESFFSGNALPWAASVKMIKGTSPSIEETAAQVMNEMGKTYESYLADGAEALLDEYSALCVTLGRSVRAIYKDRVVIGTGEKIDPNGNLIIKSEGELIAVDSGEVSVRGMMDYI